MVFFHASEAVFSKWTGLRLAVDGGWGGADSDAKGMELFELVMGQFHATATGAGKPVDRDDLGDYLFNGLDELFNVVMEDGSCDAVAQELCTLFDEVAAGNMERANAFIAEMQAPSSALGQSVEGAAPEEAEAEFSDGEDGASMEPEHTGPDADGWETVPVKKKGGRRA